MKLLKVIFLICATLISLVSFATNYPPYPTPGTTPIYYGIYPVSIEVPYGKTVSNPQTFQLQFYLVNQTANTYNLSDFSLTAASPPSPNPVTVTGYTTDCNGILKSAGSGGVCNIFANIVTANNSGSPMTMNFSFKYTSGRAKATQAAPPFTVAFATGAVIPSASRTVSFVNNCTYDVWFGIASGAVDAVSPVASIQPPDPKSCNTTADCYPGSVCVNVQATPVLNHCLWNNPAPTGAGNPFHLVANNASGTIDVDFPAYDNGIVTAWNGGLAGRVGCSDSTSTRCKIADCGANPSGTACPVPGGFATPSTLAEFTFLTQNPVITATSGTPSGDTYDITLINGVTVPTSMEPTTVAWGGANTPYVCGNPGAATTTSPLVGCKWFNQAAESNDFVWVDVGGGGGTCPAGPCTVPGQVCGHTVSGATVSSSQVCGAQLGYLTADAVCAIDDHFGAPFNCNTKVNQGGTNYTLTEIFGCSVGDFKNSCYTTGATSACCGCQDWGNLVPASTQSCNGVSNSYWQTYLITNNFLPWVKEVCPTSYVYPFDDASSTFTCRHTDANNNNVVNYTVTFCPT